MRPVRQAFARGMFMNCAEEGFEPLGMEKSKTIILVSEMFQRIYMFWPKKVRPSLDNQ